MVEIPVSSFVNMPLHPLFENQTCCRPTLDPTAIQLDNKISSLKNLILVNALFNTHPWFAKMLTVNTFDWFMFMQEWFHREIHGWELSVFKHRKKVLIQRERAVISTVYQHLCHCSRCVRGTNKTVLYPSTCIQLILLTDCPDELVHWSQFSTVSV